MEYPSVVATADQHEFLEAVEYLRMTPVANHAESDDHSQERERCQGEYTE
jgi:hypothetical protein